jgi:sugar lactone lactonase YvrE
MKPHHFYEGLCFGEGPRWHDGHLYVSDMHGHEVLTFDSWGRKAKVVDVPQQPSGLGWLPNGELLIVSMTDRKLLRFDGNQLHTHADLSGLATFHCNDMVVDTDGRAYVGNFGFDLHAGDEFKPAVMIAVAPDGSATIAADDLAFPNGTVITPDGDTLIVGESFGGRLTAFSRDRAGKLTDRRIWAQLPQGVVPDGICLDEADGIWVASPTSNECLRVEEGGNITHRVTLEQGAFACALGGTGRRSLFMLTAPGSHPDQCRARRAGRIEVVDAPYAAAGLP